MNLKGGLRRLAIAVAVPYYCIVLYLAWSGYQKIRESQQLFDLFMSIEEPQGELLSQSSSLKWDGQAQLYQALGFGVIYPAIAAILFFVGRWIWQGFRQTEA